MKSLLKLAIPIGLGILATVLNFMAGASNQKLVYFLAANSDIPAGTIITDQHVKQVGIPANQVGSLKGTAVPYSEKAVLFGRPCPRALKENDLIFYRDVSPSDPEMDLRDNEVAIHLSLEGFITTSLPSILNIGDEIDFLVPKRPPELGKGSEKAGDKNRVY